MISKIVVIIGVLGAINALPVADEPPQYGQQPPQYGQAPQRYEDEVPKTPYQFHYGVNDEYTGTDFGHQEISDGDSVQGSYQVALPDGRIQTVKYVADHHNGYVAEVTYEGQAQFPEEPQQYEQPQYAPQPPQQPQYAPQPPQQPQYAPQPPQHQVGYSSESKPIYSPQPAAAVEEAVYSNALESAPIYTN